MQNYSIQLLFDPESNQTYQVELDPEDAARAKTDAVFAQSLLFHAKCTDNIATIENAGSVITTNEQESEHDEISQCEFRMELPLQEQKRKRFRFNDIERIKCIKELFGILAEDNIETEEELWSKLHQILMYDNPDRFGVCSLRLLKEHMLEQVTKYRKYDSNEATESGKERLQTDWGESMKELMLVWENYIKVSVNKQKNPVGRPRKVSLSQEQQNVELAKQIRDAAMQTLCNIGSPRDKENVENNEGMVEDSSDSSGSSGRSKTPIFKTQHAPCSAKKKTPKESCVFSYLAEKAKMDNDLKKKEIQLNEKKHLDKIRLQEETLVYKKQKLEFEKEKWNLEAERNNSLLRLLETVVKKNQ